MQRLLVASLVVWICTTSSAFANPRVKQIEYLGVHPIPVEAGGGFCDIEGPHVHIYLPEHATELYRVVDKRYVFVGDPVPFGYDGPKHAYYGPHRVPSEMLVADGRPHDEPVFCYLEGPHYHVYEPPPSAPFVVRGGAYWYTGDWPRSFQIDASRFAKINVVYEPLLYARPIVIASPPVGYHVPVIEVSARAPVPSVVVDRPAPFVEVYTAPWIVVEPGYDYDVYYHHHHDDDDD